MAKIPGIHAFVAWLRQKLMHLLPSSGRAHVLYEEAQILIKVGAAVTSELELERAVQVVTDAATELSEAAFGAFFYNVTNENGEAYTLYSLSGVSREAFANFPMPRNTKVFGPTFRGEGIVRSDDITKDERYGQNKPYFGMPKGHPPVRSYLAVPVALQKGEVLGGLFLGHPEVGVFTARAERIVAAIATQAAVAIDKARIYRAATDEIKRREKIEIALRESEELLEAKVADRIADLAAANALLAKEAAEREKAEGQFRILVEGVTDHAIYMLDTNGIVTSWNTGAERIKGYRAKEIIGQHFERFFTEEDRAIGLPSTALKTAAENGRFESEGWRVREDGSLFWANAIVNAIHDDRGQLRGFAKITRDITERREAALALQKSQERLAQAQKMEGIGHLTGGIAHDFNNLLTIIIGNLETLQRITQKANPEPGRITRSVDNAMRGAQRAAALTQRLLAFSRQQPLAPKNVDVSKIVSGMSDLLRRSLGEQIVIETVLAGGLWRTSVDPNQLEVSILNLAVNARDAMSEQGKLTIETANAYLDEGYAASQAEVVPGQYVVVCVSDTGCGMPREVMERAFEPFYTTKEVGHGTGLGLSQVYGFVKQSGGHVKIYSEVGEGTTVKLYLPRLHASEAEVPEHEFVNSSDHPEGSEAILVVEDEEDVRAHSVEMLRDLGYYVFETANGSSALQILQSHPEIQLLFTDVGLPGGMNGRQLADAARHLRPDLKVLFTTGYARNAIVHDGRLDPGVQLITKPFTYAGLASKIRDILDTRSKAGRVLLVEDDFLVQQYAIEQLEHIGFEVETANSATEAMSKLRLLNGDVEAVIVDIGLPDKRGDDLVSEMRAYYPDLPVVIASGYGEDSIRAKVESSERTSFLPKPYTAEQVKKSLEDVLHRRLSEGKK